MRVITLKSKWIVAVLIILLVSCGKESEIDGPTDPDGNEEPSQQKYIEVKPVTHTVSFENQKISIEVKTSFNDISVHVSDTNWIKMIGRNQQIYSFTVFENYEWDKRSATITFIGDSDHKSTVNITQTASTKGIIADFQDGDYPFSIKIKIDCYAPNIYATTKEPIQTLGCFYGTDSSKLDKGGKYFEFYYADKVATNRFAHIYPFDLIPAGTKLYAKAFYTTANHVVYGKTLSYTIFGSNPPAPTYEIPVVFHVLTDPRVEGNHINDNLIKEILASTNLIFRGCSRSHLSDWIPADTKVSFKLENIVRYEKGVVENIIDKTGKSAFTFLRDETPGLQYYDPKKYINIWIIDCDDVAGVGSVFQYVRSGGIALPGFNVNDTVTEPSSKGKLGIVIANLFKSEDNIKTVNYYSTLAHELGHYLGLYHAFTESGCDETNDYCEDTPNYNRAEYIPVANQLNFNRIGCNGVIFESTNVMDYFYSRRLGFTPNQCERMQYAIKYGVFIPDGD